MWSLHAGFLAEEVAPVVPAPVLAEAWRGGPGQANLVRVLSMCNLEWVTEDQARKVGVLAGQSNHDDVVDVTVADGAFRRGDAVVTSNREHIDKVGQAAGLTLSVGHQSTAAWALATSRSS